MITFIIDDLSQCLIEANTGDVVETEVLRVTRKSFLQKFKKLPDGMLTGQSLALK